MEDISYDEKSLLTLKAKFCPPKPKLEVTRFIYVKNEDNFLCIPSNCNNYQHHWLYSGKAPKIGHLSRQ